MEMLDIDLNSIIIIMYSMLKTVGMSFDMYIMSWLTDDYEEQNGDSTNSIAVCSKYSTGIIGCHNDQIVKICNPNKIKKIEEKKCTNNY